MNAVVMSVNVFMTWTPSNIELMDAPVGNACCLR